MKSKYVVISILILLSVVMFKVQSFEKPSGYIYDAVRDNRSLVLNINSNWLSFQSKVEASIGDDSSEFSSYIVACGNSHYWCISGPIEILIPKNIERKHWEYAHISCISIINEGKKNYKITCGSVGNKYRTIFSYSVIRGVTSISKSGTNDRSVFLLREKCGLFGTCNLQNK